MSFHTANLQPTYPATTTTVITATTDTTATTVTTTTTTTAAPTTVLKMVTRPTGGHASTLGLSWETPDDRAKYLDTTGLPPIYAAVINDDWELAATMLSAKQIGTTWQFDPRAAGAAGAADWQNGLTHPNKQVQKVAIIEMALALVHGSTTDDAGCLHGTSLLTLCLKKHAPAAFLKQLIASIKAHSPDGLNLPDPSGRTPLYVAAEQGVKEQVTLLLAEGADPIARCNFQQISDPADMPTAHEAAVNSQHQEIFEILLGKSMASSDWLKAYQAGDDVLSLRKWTSRHSADEVRALAGRFPDLALILMNADDKSGNSGIYRCIANGDWPDVPFHPLGRSAWEKKPLCVAAALGQADIFFRMLDICLTDGTFKQDRIDAERIIADFLKHSPVEKAIQLPERWPDAKNLFCELISESRFLGEISSNFGKFSNLVAFAWPLLDARQRTAVVMATSNLDAHHLRFVMGLGHVEVEHNYWRLMQLVAASNRKTALYELIETYSPFVSNAIAALQLGEMDVPIELIAQVLNAGSTLLFDRFIQASLDVQLLLDADSELFLAYLADCNPSRLRDWLAGCEFTVTDEALDNARTEAGRQALITLKTEKTSGEGNVASGVTG